MSAPAGALRASMRKWSMGTWRTVPGLDDAGRLRWHASGAVSGRGTGMEPA